MSADPILRQTPAQAARSRRGLVTSPHPLASQAGLAVLAEGGNAVEAAIAIAAALCVVYPHFTGLGGDAFWLLADGQGAVQAISGIGQAAQDVGGYGAGIPVRGPRSALTSAAAVDSWAQAHAFSAAHWQGRLGWSRLLDPAVVLASEGFPVSASQALWAQRRGTELGTWPGFVAQFCAQGRHPAPGQPVRLPALARTLARLAQQGPREFYEGELAERLAAGLEAAGSPLRLADLQATRARCEAPLRLPYRQGELLTIAPPTQGITTLQAMGILSHGDLASLGEGSAQHYHRVVEAIKRAFIDRDRWLADPEFADVPVAELLAPDHLQRLAQGISPDMALPWPHRFQTGDTVYIAVADGQGRCVSLLQTIYYDWGSGVVAGDTGVLWHNRGAAFHPDPAHRNGLQPGKRPFHTLNPGIYLEGGRPRLLYGTQGADGQPQTLAMLLTRLIDHGLDPLEALRRPRFLLGRTFSDSRDSLKLESDVGAAVMDTLRRLGHEVQPIEAQSALAGQPGVIHLAPDGWLEGAHDPRSEGLALGL
ncbi:gamma-glutamyltransferase family protein [Ideonella oryzae]|uniref:Gamma-glutamyltransferase family protein n=1 Tax=Ideonella oryzae TaxID=2937441 RepID=A0ABT1BHQ1_9BURK|nr:gamma-glutamyltransferase family protein [Ideonella oryzae]MCO5975578.1 gamma-glutamyltransferase family protein [Ideonella oryzae]